MRQDLYNSAFTDSSSMCTAPKPPLVTFKLDLSVSKLLAEECPAR